MRDDGLPHRSRLANGWLQMHQQTWSCVHLDDGTTLGQQGFADVLRHQVDASNVQTNHAGGQHHHRRYFRVHLVGDVDAHVAGALHDGDAVFLWDAVGAEALTLQLQHGGGQVFQTDGVQRKVFFFTTARVGVDL